MGNAIISRGGGSISLAGDGSALVRVQTFEGATVTATSGTKVFTKSSTGLVELSLSYGTWTITSTSSEMTLSAELVIDTLKVYELNLCGRTYGISIDMSNSDPESAVTYIGMAEGMTPLSCNLSTGACDYGDWEDIIKEIFGCKPCLYLNGARSVYLNPNDYSKTEAGATADITSGSAGDVMVEFKRTWYRYAKDGDTLTFEVSDYDRTSEGFVSSAFYSMDGNATIKDYMYYGAYEGYNASNKLRSLSGKTPTGNVSYTNNRTYCQALGSSYGMEDYCKRQYILGLLMLVTKSRGIQAAIGHGRIGSNSSAATTGTLNTYGLFAGFSDETKSVKCFGIENMWGSMYNWCDGIVTTSGTTLGLKACPPYNDTGSGYTTVSDGISRGSWLYATAMTPVLNGAAAVASTAQASVVGWPDGVVVGSSAGDVAGVGGYWSDALDQYGPFCVYVYYSPSYTSANLGARVVAA